MFSHRGGLQVSERVEIQPICTVSRQIDLKSSDRNDQSDRKAVAVCYRNYRTSVAVFRRWSPTPVRSDLGLAVAKLGIDRLRAEFGTVHRICVLQQFSLAHAVQNRLACHTIEKEHPITAPLDRPILVLRVLVQAR